MIKEIKDFILHLRLNYNFLILSAPFLLGAFYVSKIADATTFITQFLIVYVFLFGGVNAYNSHFDKDEGPIGGLEKPPKMKKWMYYAAWALQIIGLLISTRLGLIYTLIFILSVFLSWLYSNPKLRFKGKPIASLFVVGLGVVISPTLMGYLASGGKEFNLALILGAVGSAFIILSMYPFSQAYQREEDTKRGDITFAVKYGLGGLKKLFLVMFPLGIILLAYSFTSVYQLAILAIALGLAAYVSIWQIIKNIEGKKEEYKKIMRTKYYGGLFFTFIILFLLFLT